MTTRTYLGIPRDEIPWKPNIDEEKCIGCGQCLEVCPNGVYEMDEAAGKMKIVQPMNCVVLCDKCMVFCDQHAITFPDKEATKRLIAEKLRARAQQPKTNDGQG